MPACLPVVFSTLRGARGGVLAALLGAALLALAACSGTAVVTLTSTASPDNFLAYRVGLVSVQLQASSGNSGLTVLPATTTIDLAALTDVSEMLGAESVTNGQALGLVQVKLSLDPSDPFSIASKGASQLALDFNLAASNLVNLSGKTVTVTPLIAVSSLPIDAKSVRIRGSLASVAGIANSTAASGSVTLGVMPFNTTASGGGVLAVIPSDSTTYEINGIESTGITGQGQLAALGTGALAVVYGTLTNATQPTTTSSGAAPTVTSTTVSFVADQILAGSSVQTSGLDRVSGIVAARSGNTLAVADATMLGADGQETFLGGTTTVLLGPNTLVTVFGQGGTQVNNPQQVSVGSKLAAFGVATVQSSVSATLDVSAGHVRLDTTTASGLVAAQGAGALTLNLAFLGGRAIAPFDFIGSGASAAQYEVAAGTLDLTNSTPGAPVIVTGMTGPFGAAPPNFTAATLLDPSTIQAELIVDWASGTAAPFTTYNSSAIDIERELGELRYFCGIHLPSASAAPRRDAGYGSDRRRTIHRIDVYTKRDKHHSVLE